MNDLDIAMRDLLVCQKAIRFLRSSPKKHDSAEIPKSDRVKASKEKYRNQKILAFVMRTNGLTAQEIADDLGISRAYAYLLIRLGRNLADRGFLKPTIMTKQFPRGLGDPGE